MSYAIELLRLATAAAEPNASVTFDTLNAGLQRFNGHKIRFHSNVNGVITGTVKVSEIVRARHTSLISSLPNIRQSRWFDIWFTYASETEHMFTHVYTVYDNPYSEGSPLYGGIAVVRETFVDGVVVPQLATPTSAPVFFQNLYKFELKRVSDLRVVKRARKRVTAADTVQRVPGVWCGYQIKFNDGTVVPTDSGCKGKCMMQYDPVTGRIYQYGPDGFKFNGRMMPGREEATAAVEPAAVSDWENLPDRIEAACKRFQGQASLNLEFDTLEFEADAVNVSISTGFSANNGEDGSLAAEFFYHNGVLECYIGGKKLIGRKMPNPTPAQWVVVVPAVLTYLDQILVRLRTRLDAEIHTADAEFSASLSKMFRAKIEPNPLNLHVSWST